MSARKSRVRRAVQGLPTSSPERALSALLQAFLAQDVGGSRSAMADAFLLEFSGDLAAAQVRGPRVVGELCLSLMADLAEASLATAAHAAAKTGTTPAELLAELLGTYKEGSC